MKKMESELERLNRALSDENSAAARKESENFALANRKAEIVLAGVPGKNAEERDAFVFRNTTNERIKCESADRAYREAQQMVEIARWRVRFAVAAYPMDYDGAK